MKTLSQVSAESIRRVAAVRFNPIRGLTPEGLGQKLEQFKRGHLREFTLLAEEMIERDDTLQCVVPKRYKSVGRLDWEVLAVDDSAEARAHQEALRAFYQTLRCQNAFDLDEEGGVSLLIRQMMSAVGLKYAVHELVWEPRGETLGLTARFVPLHFFERTQGRLRFVHDEFGGTGEDLEPGGWLVTVGEPLMIASSVACMFKRLPLQDWLNFTEKFGFPLVLGKTSARKGTEEWSALLEAVGSISNDWSGVVSAGSQIDFVSATNGGHLPFEALVDRMDRALARLWRGADLSTLSRGQGMGASVQAEEAEIFLADDARLISETLQQRLDRWVIEYRFGVNVRPRAYFQLQIPATINVERDIRVDEHLVRHGARLDLQAALERYGRTQAATDAAALNTQEEA